MSMSYVLYCHAVYLEFMLDSC